MSRRTQARDIHGILLLDKPKNMTSNAALLRVKKTFFANKAGHTGSLDPLASGMLPICLGEATKFSQFLLEADKRYLVEARLGIKTTTGDAEGTSVSEQEVSGITASRIENVLRDFRGTISQVPSMYSAIKYQGKPLYQLARQGIEVERKAREVKIHELILLGCDKDHFTVSVGCSKGTYIRTLIDDIGDVLACGAHVASLRRTHVGPYTEDKMIRLEEIESKRQSEGIEALDAYLSSMDSIVSFWREVRLSDLAAYYLRQGQPVIVPRAPSEGWVRLSLSDGKFLGVGEILADGRVAPRRLINILF